MVGDIIVITSVDPEDVKASANDGDVIVFYHPRYSKDRGWIIVHRAIARTSQGFVTKGDNNPYKDSWIVPYDNLIGKWTGFKIPFWTGLGYISLFLRGEIMFPLGIVLLIMLIATNVFLMVKGGRKANDRD